MKTNEFSKKMIQKSLGKKSLLFRTTSFYRAPLDDDRSITLEGNKKMTFSIGIVLYAMIWVVTLFLVLPWGVHIPDKVEPGHATSAPENPHIGLKLLITSILAAFIWVIAYLILKPA